MKEHNNIEQFDEIFKQQLGNASAPVPPGLWEGISSSVGSGAGAATVTVKTALWMKAVVAVSVVGVISAVTYGVLSQKEPEAQVRPAVETVRVETQKPENSPVDSDLTVAPVQSEVISTKETAGTTTIHEHQQKHKKGSDSWHSVSQPDQQGKSRPKIQFYEIKDEVSNTYLSKMSNNVVPGFDSAKLVKPTEKADTEIPYIPETPPIAHFVDSSFIYVPNVVTPNGDGVNDEYLIDIKGEEFVQIIIYDSKSIKVFETKNKNTAWDCKMPNGEIAPEGDYVVKVIYKFKNKSKSTAITQLKLIK